MVGDLDDTDICEYPRGMAVAQMIVVVVVISILSLFGIATPANFVPAYSILRLRPLAKRDRRR